MASVAHVPYTVEQDETDWWCAHAPLPGGGANGEGRTADEAVADLREALAGWFAEFEASRELTVTVPDTAYCWAGTGRAPSDLSLRVSWPRRRSR